MLLHELAHGVGLDHVKNPGQLMNPSADRAPNGYGSGDLAGLAKVGRKAGCLNGF